ncbi:beta-mannosidase [Pelobium manganitolerans]|uniref:mannan endo-1,4-beta-mannosidase n=1 Tax=Pelobium manganitolerans TaxID=1842495 RepID=A0A419SBM5_9SPHI|nr:cellulase family glycosylhydrolase [Pelobium manganitolerans]RKD20225.1 beta-mannosidase [Pelobium manganitolerans]
MKTIRGFGLFMFLLSFAFGGYAQNDFVKVQNQHFTVNGKPYYFIGTNYWYGGLLALQKDPKHGKQRLIEELDFLKSKGVDNLRVLVGSEGEGKINGVDRVKPVLQKSQGVYSKEILEGLDFLLTEMAKRKMYAVLFLSNNWEWSGGFLQYLNWNGRTDLETMQKKMSWDELRDETSKFYTCEPCKNDYLKQLDYIFAHTSIYTGKKYVDDATIMAWELANEPRPMRATAIPAFKTWIKEVAQYIKSKDPHHLVTIGSEGTQGTEDSLALWKEIHSYPEIDYSTIHIWAKNWGWFKADSIKEALPLILSNTKNYIRLHATAAEAINKPLVVEEFGLPRDAHDFKAGTATQYRDQLYQVVLDELLAGAKNRGVVGGLNFWGFGGTSRPIEGQVFWKDGDDFSGDPPQEEQGLNTVYDNDKSTWKLIRKYAKAIKKALD